MKMTKRQLARLDTIIYKLNDLRCVLRDEGHDDDEDIVMEFLGNAAIDLDEAWNKAESGEGK